MLVISFFGADYWPVQFLTILFVATITMAAMIEYVALVKHKGDPPSKYLLASIGGILAGRLFSFSLLDLAYPPFFGLFCL